MMMVNDIGGPFYCQLFAARSDGIYQWTSPEPIASYAASTITSITPSATISSLSTLGGQSFTVQGTPFFMFINGFDVLVLTIIMVYRHKFWSITIQP
jgi:hypothetical protein